MHQVKVAKCCYCGNKTVLQLTARDGHELACGSCGAALHEMKALKSASGHKPKHEPKGTAGVHAKAKTSKKAKKSKPFWKEAMGEAFDIIEDIFD